MSAKSPAIVLLMVYTGVLRPPDGPIGFQKAPPRKPRVVTRLTASIAEATPPAIIFRFVVLSIALTITGIIIFYGHQLYLVPWNRTPRPENRTVKVEILAHSKCLGGKRLNSKL